MAAVKRKPRKKPQDRSKLTRNKVVQIRLTEEEVAALKKAAAEAEMSMADYVMGGVHQRRRISLPGGDEIWRELLREGRNLNQALVLAYRLHKEAYTVNVKSIEDAVAKVEKNQELLTELIQKWDVDLTAKV